MALINLRKHVIGPATPKLLTQFKTDMNDAFWTKYRATVTTSRTDPAGGSTAEGVFETAVNNSHNIAKEGVYTLVKGRKYRLEAVVASIGGRTFTLSVYDGSLSVGYNKTFDLPNGALGSETANYGGIALNAKATINKYANNSYYRCRLDFTAGLDVVGCNLYWGIQTTSSSTGGYLGDVTKGIDFYEAGFYQL